MKQEGRREFIMNEIVKYLLVVIPLLIILEGLLFLITQKGYRKTGSPPVSAPGLYPGADSSGMYSCYFVDEKRSCFPGFLLCTGYTGDPGSCLYRGCAELFYMADMV